MRRLRFAAALTIVGVMVATILGTASAAQAAPPARCTVNQLLALTPSWNVSCTKSRTVTIAVSIDAMDSAIPPQPVHQDHTFQQQVTPGTPWISELGFPAGWFIYEACATVTSSGATLASTCFLRSPTPTAPCVLGALGGLDPVWQFGCLQAGENVSVDLSYQYTQTHSKVVLSDRKIFNYSVAGNVTDGFTPPAGVTIVDSSIIVTDTTTGETLGKAKFSR